MILLIGVSGDSEKQKNPGSRQAEAKCVLESSWLHPYDLRILTLCDVTGAAVEAARLPETLLAGLFLVYWYCLVLSFLPRRSPGQSMFRRLHKPALFLIAAPLHLRISCIHDQSSCASVCHYSAVQSWNAPSDLFAVADYDCYRKRRSTVFQLEKVRVFSLQYYTSNRLLFKGLLKYILFFPSGFFETINKQTFFN
jgi:hypothetical protein